MSVYSDCGLFGFNKTLFDKSLLCGKDTKFVDGKCVADLDITSDNVSVCGNDTKFVDGKCVADFSVCGNDTKFVDGKCIADVDITKDNSKVCGNDTKFVDGKCIADVDITKDNSKVCGKGTFFTNGMCQGKISNCARGTHLVKGKCEINYIPDKSLIQNNKLRPGSSVGSKLDMERYVEINNGVPERYSYIFGCRN